MPSSRPKDLSALIRTACPCKLHLGCGAALEDPEARWAGIGGPETAVPARGGATRCTLAQGGARRGGAGGKDAPWCPCCGRSAAGAGGRRPQESDLEVPPMPEVTSGVCQLRGRAGPWTLLQGKGDGGMKHRHDRKQSQQVTWQVLSELRNESPHTNAPPPPPISKEAGSSVRVGRDRVSSSSNVVKTLLNSSRAILPPILQVIESTLWG